MAPKIEWYELCYYPEGEISLENQCDPYSEGGNVVHFRTEEDAFEELKNTPMARRDLDKAVNKFAIFRYRSEIRFSAPVGGLLRVFKNPKIQSEWYELMYFPGEWDFSGPIEHVSVKGMPIVAMTFGTAFKVRKNLLDWQKVPEEERGKYQIVRTQLEIVQPRIREYGVRRYGI